LLWREKNSYRPNVHPESIILVGTESPVALILKTEFESRQAAFATLPALIQLVQTFMRSAPPPGF
jgi:hypothetical protein